MNETCAPSFRLSLLVIFCFLILSSAAWGAADSNHLLPNEVLLSDQSLTLPDGERILHMQIDGNLVLKGPSVSRQLWQSGTADNPGAYYRMQGDGNFVIYSATEYLDDGGPKPLWSSETWGNPGAELVMGEDGNLVIWGPPMRIPIWQTWTSGNPGAYYIMQGDGNLVVYSADDEPLWSSGTWGNRGVPSSFLRTAVWSL